MQVEVDQSGKVEATQKPTVLALANGMRYSIRISAKAKRIVLAEMEKRKPRRSRTQHRLRLFSILVFLLLKDHLGRMDHVIIDVEYTKRERSIKDWVMVLCKRHGITIYRDMISFRQVTRKSPAHDLAIKVYRGEVRPSREIEAEEVLELI
jgi:hypothetical protein